MNTGSRIKFGSFNSRADRVTFNAIKKSERAAKRARAVRLARRDAEYAAAHVPVTVEVRDLRNSELGQIMRIETRGQVCIAPRITHIGHV